jgi:hypothetical protein
MRSMPMPRPDQPPGDRTVLRRTRGSTCGRDRSSDTAVACDQRSSGVSPTLSSPSRGQAKARGLGFVDGSAPIHGCKGKVEIETAIAEARWSGSSVAVGTQSIVPDRDGVFPAGRQRRSRPRLENRPICRRKSSKSRLIRIVRISLNRKRNFDGSPLGFRPS